MRFNQLHRSCGIDLGRVNSIIAFCGTVSLPKVNTLCSSPVVRQALTQARMLKLDHCYHPIMAHKCPRAAQIEAHVGMSVVILRAH